MYCFRHSGVMCADRCSANFILCQCWRLEQSEVEMAIIYYRYLLFQLQFALHARLPRNITQNDNNVEFINDSVMSVFLLVE